MICSIGKNLKSPIPDFFRMTVLVTFETAVKTKHAKKCFCYVEVTFNFEYNWLKIGKLSRFWQLSRFQYY